jgi:hypothetical protein
MLNELDEKRLNAWLNASDEELAKDLSNAKFYVPAARWLAEKLKECNDELKNNEGDL